MLKGAEPYCMPNTVLYTVQRLLKRVCIFLVNLLTLITSALEQLMLLTLQQTGINFDILLLLLLL